MRRSLRVLGALLEYPGEELISALPEMRFILDEEQFLGAGDRAALQSFMAELASRDLMDLQEDYVDTFDRGRATCLNLFEHVHGESRDRGQAMVDLQNVYANAGLTLSANELPDYLPALLEYLSLRSRAEVTDMLADCATILQRIGAALARRESPYAVALRILLRLAGERHPEKLLAATPVEEDATPESIDRAWVEEPVTFMGGCTPQRPQTDMIHFHKGAAS